MTEVIKFSGDSSLGETDRKLAVDIFRDFYPKVKRMINNEVSFEVVFKEYKKRPTQLRVVKNKLQDLKNVRNRERKGKFSIEFRVIAPTDIFEISVSDWDLTRTLRKACEKMSTEIEHRFHVSDK